MSTLNRNVGFIDRLVRGLVAIDLLALCLADFISGFSVFIAISLAAYFAFSGATGHCFVYGALGRSSRRRTEP